MNYDAFVASKAFVSEPSGLATVPPLNPILKEHQRLLTSWALRRGRAALFCDTGLGKTLCELQWSQVLADHTGKPALILAPLAVSHQFQREGERFGFPVTVCASQTDVQPGVNITNYHKLHKFSADAFGSVALDEASILKSLDGATRKMLIASFRNTPYRLAATATPSPNDHTELGGQAEFLGLMTHQEMLASFFIRDGGKTQDWRLKGHAREVFWRWCASWGAFVKLPSDIGADDTGYILPPLEYHEHIVPATLDDARRTGMLFAEPASTLNGQRAARRGTLGSRVTIAANIANSAKGQVICWCDLNDESAALSEAIPGSVEVTGSMSDDEKESAIDQFMTGRARVCVSKGSLMGWGLNMQFARTVIFCGVSHSFETMYQCIRRSWRFGVDGTVDAHIISSELEGAVLANIKRKMVDADEMSNETRRHVSAYVRESITKLARETTAYSPTISFNWPAWLRTETA